MSLYHHKLCLCLARFSFRWYYANKYDRPNRGLLLQTCTYVFAFICGLYGLSSRSAINEKINQNPHEIVEIIPPECLQKRKNRYLNSRGLRYYLFVSFTISLHWFQYDGVAFIFLSIQEPLLILESKTKLKLFAVNLAYCGKRERKRKIFTTHTHTHTQQQQQQHPQHYDADNHSNGNENDDGNAGDVGENNNGDDEGTG
uniref:Uncharacterized protein n=1 Tax=Glossina brevipalpis TaxID=37001 RepID=A0A1A9WIZ4_9MUSC